MSNDNKIVEYRKKVEAKRTSLGNKPKKVFKTNGVFKHTTFSENLNLLNTVEKCREFLAVVAILEVANQQVNKWLDREDVLKSGEYSLEDYVDDVKLMVSIAEWEEEKRKLADMDAQLKELMSNEGKTAEAIADIGAALELD